MSIIRGDLAVRSAAAYLFARGDLYPVRPGPKIDAETGLRVQQAVQSRRRQQIDDYLAEVAVGTELILAGSARRLAGRIDGLYRDGSTLVLEEYKACGLLPEEPDPIDLGQLWQYAGLITVAGEAPDTPPALRLKLIYVQADTGEERAFEYMLSPDQAAADLAWCMLCLDVRLKRHHARIRLRQRWAAQLAFPLPRYRPSQQSLARRVYRALKNTEHLLLEAPTGSGKTLGVLFPAIKAQQENGQTFFLTSRNAGARAALDAAAQLDPQAAELVVVELTAKDKVCFVAGMPCNAEACPYARGYHDRVQMAVNELLRTRFCNRQAIETVAQRFEVCPFELALDTSSWADLVIGDYNYIFDPVVRLQRFVDHDALQILVDEAHQISPRVREMLAVELSRAQVRSAADVADATLRRRVASIDRALMKLRRQAGEGDHVVADVQSLERAMARLLEQVAQLDFALDEHPPLLQLCFAAARWQRSAAWYRPEEFVQLLQVRGRDVSIRRICLDPAFHIHSILSAYPASIRFSGTVSPLELYQRLHGFADAPAERAASPFAPEQNEVMVVTDVSTYFQQRSQSLPRLISLIHALVESTDGRCLVALPSYAYLRMAADAFGDAHPGVAVCVQQPGQDHLAVSDLLTEFAAHARGVLFIVSGGVMGESVDFIDVKLTAVMLVGLGLPPPSVERDMQADYFERQEGEGWGQMVAYTQPALVRNIQAAGRLIRSPEDAGVICLVDHRFTRREVQQFLPGHWQPHAVGARQVADRAARFRQTHEAADSLHS